MELPSARKRLLCQLSRSEEHTSELQSQSNLVCRLLLEKKKNTIITPPPYAASTMAGRKSAPTPKADSPSPPPVVHPHELRTLLLPTCSAPCPSHRDDGAQRRTWRV